MRLAFRSKQDTKAGLNIAVESYVLLLGLNKQTAATIFLSSAHT